ncbi:hypothetical protein [Amorphus orientalis]|uniref:Uncharacterized protein n=1 Tax=Amorphus orientalis TaxID=649198 RepID=A0AAE3VKG3_9HYPH|nr:hypothetical protein [Amorphus orientalis]MDQ0313711.1 hypothetical protein [Amorphus orientalis]
MTRSMAAAALVLMTVAPIAPGLAQSTPEITVTPDGGYGYPGPYGRNLPGVYMTTNSGLPISPDINSGKLKTPNLDEPVNGYTYDQPHGPVDGWNGAIGPGIPF